MISEDAFISLDLLLLVEICLVAPTNASTWNQGPPSNNQVVWGCIWSSYYYRSSTTSASGNAGRKGLSDMVMNVDLTWILAYMPHVTCQHIWSNMIFYLTVNDCFFTRLQHICRMCQTHGGQTDEEKEAARKKVEEMDTWSASSWISTFIACCCFNIRCSNFTTLGKASAGGHHLRHHLHRPLADYHPKDARPTGGAGHQW